MTRPVLDAFAACVNAYRDGDPDTIKAANDAYDATYVDAGYPRPDLYDQIEEPDIDNYTSVADDNAAADAYERHLGWAE